MTPADARADFLLSRRLGGCTAKTLEYYRVGLDAPKRFCAAQGVGDAGRLSQTLLWALVASLLDCEGLRPSPPAPSGWVVRAFARCCHADGHLPADPAAGVERLKVDEAPPKTVARDDVPALLEARNPRTCLGARNRLLALLLFDTGCRRGEAVTLPVDAVDLRAGAATVLGKARRPRLVPLGCALCAEAERYLCRHAAHLQEVGAADTEVLLRDAPGRCLDGAGGGAQAAAGGPPRPAACPGASAPIVCATSSPESGSHPAVTPFPCSACSGTPTRR